MSKEIESIERHLQRIDTRMLVNIEQRNELERQWYELAGRQGGLLQELQFELNKQEEQQNDN